MVPEHPNKLTSYFIRSPYSLIEMFAAAAAALSKSFLVVTNLIRLLYII